MTNNRGPEDDVVIELDRTLDIGRYSEPERYHAESAKEDAAWDRFAAALEKRRARSQIP